MADELNQAPLGDGGSPRKAAFPTTLVIIVAAMALVGAGGFFAGKIFSGKGGDAKKDGVAQADPGKKQTDAKPEVKPTDGADKKPEGENPPANGEQKSDAAATPETKIPVEGKTGLLAMDEFTVNLNDPFGKRYAMMAINLEITTKELVTRIKEDPLLNAKIRDVIFMIISAKSYNELISVAGRFTLKEEIQMRVNEKIKETLNTEPVKDVLFTKYLLQ
jgi:flagellar basal body-associated protein FliL